MEWWWCWDEVTEKQERFEEGITHKALNRCKLIVEVLRVLPDGALGPLLMAPRAMQSADRNPQVLTG